MKKISINKSTELDYLAKRYVWWNTIDWAYLHPEVFISNIMNLGNWDDILRLNHAVSKQTLKIVLNNAPAGSFHPRSWDYWNAKLGINPALPLPSRKF